MFFSQDTLWDSTTNNHVLTGTSSSQFCFKTSYQVSKTIVLFHFSFPVLTAFRDVVFLNGLRIDRNRFKISLHWEGRREIEIYMELNNDLALRIVCSLITLAFFIEH